MEKELGDGDLIGISALNLNATFPNRSSTDLGLSFSATSQDDDLLDAGSDAMDVVEGESLWHLLPEDVLHLIMMRLSLASQRRSRLVCRQWEQVLFRIPDATPPCMLMPSSGVCNNKFFCHSEAKWFTLPFRPHPSRSSGGNWKIVDTNAGLVLHHCNIKVEGRPFVRLCVCNPLTSSSRDISPKDPVGRGKSLLGSFKAKLLVDPVSKSFKVVLLILQLKKNNHANKWTMIFDSTKSRWDTYGLDSWFDGVSFRFQDLFVWKNVLYAYNVHGHHVLYLNDISHFVIALDMESGQWTRVKAEFPRGPDLQTVWSHFILSNNMRVRLFQFVPKRSKKFLVWELLAADGSSDVPSFSRSNWEFRWTELDIGLQEAIDGIVGSWSRVRHVYFGAECIFLTFYSDKMSEDGVNPQRGLRYSFADGRWREIPSPGIGERSGEFHKLHLWVPGLEVDSS